MKTSDPHGGKDSALVSPVRRRNLSWLDWITMALPRFLGGFTFSGWLRFLQKHGSQVDAFFLPRASTATVGTIATSLIKPIDDAYRWDPRDEAAWRRPMFILGHGRSGTTHLFNLLARDPQFAFPTQLDVFNPHTFITLRRLGLDQVLGLLPKRKRAMDAVRVGWLSPGEDSIALNVLSGRGAKMQSIFPRASAWEDMTSEEFRAALTAFTRKLVHIHHRPLLLKSPEHTKRVRDILNVFPAACFVMIFRNPETLLASIVKTAQSPAMVWNALQWPSPRTMENLIESVRESIDAYFEAKPFIPPGQLVELRHEDLVQDEAGTLASIYSKLGLTGDPASLELSRRPPDRPYQSTAHAPLDEPTRASLRLACRRLHEARWYVSASSGQVEGK